MSTMAPMIVRKKITAGIKPITYGSTGRLLECRDTCSVRLASKAHIGFSPMLAGVGRSRFVGRRSQVQTIPRVVVLGGGFGGLETAFYLRHRAGDKVAITLVSDQSVFVFKPNTIYIPFGKSPKELLIQLEKPLAKQKIAFEQGRAIAVDATEKTVTVAEIDGADRKLSYDYLVVATGAGMRPAEVPGLTENALTIWSIGDMLRLRDAYARLVRDAREGQRRRVLFVVPPN